MIKFDRFNNPEPDLSKATLKWTSADGKTEAYSVRPNPKAKRTIYLIGV